MERLAINRDGEVFAVTLRRAKRKDHHQIVGILNAAIHKRQFTALLTPVTVEGRQPWFRLHRDGIHQIYVAEVAGEVVGWMAVTAFRSGREAFARTAELSYYIDPNFQRLGLSKILMDYTIRQCQKRGLVTLLAVVFADNEGSLHLLQGFGFKEWGRFPEIVEIDGRVTDCLYMGRKI